ncbi:MAG: dihydrofolate reductase [Halobacteriales archaeon]
MDLALVAAVAENGVIGADGEMPWHYPADLEHFRETTTGHPVIMGRTTFERIVDRLGEPLPERTSVVLTTRGPEGIAVDLGGDAGGAALEDREDVFVADSIEAAIAAAEGTGADVAYVIGGGSVYEQFLPRADRLLITEIPETCEGDTYFPEFDRGTWTEVAREEREVLAFVTYERREP